VDILSIEQESAIIAAVRRAGEKLLELWPKDSSEKARQALAIESKADGSFVTKADHLSNNIVVEQIRKVCPADGIISEELPYDNALVGARRVWIVDPLDGTHPFIDGEDNFSVLVALSINERAEFGIMYFPARDLFLLAKRGRGASLNGNKLRVSESLQFRDNSVRVRGFRGSLGRYECDPAVESGFAVIKLCQGELDGMVLKAGRMGEWDIAAPTIIIEESGGMVSDERGRPMLFNRKDFSFGYYVASNSHLHTQLLALVPR